MAKLHHIIFILKILLEFKLLSCSDDYFYKSLLSGKFYRFLQAGRRDVDLSCVLHNIHCLPDESNVIDVFFGVRSAGDCQLSCFYHHSECAIFTWFDSSHPTFPQSCFLYSRCSKAVEVAHSITGPPSCVCGRKMACKGANHNHVGFQEKVATETDCQAICRNTERCEFYTWFDQTNRVFHNYCFLWSSCDSVSCNCVGCSTGPPECTPQIGEILPSPAPSPALVTVENLSVPTSLLPDTENSGPSGGEGDTSESDSLILNISDVSPIEISDQAMISNIISDSLNLNTTITSTNTTISSQGLKSTILNYFPSLKWMFVFID